MAVSRLLFLQLFADSPAIRRIASVVSANFYTFNQPRIYTVALASTEYEEMIPFNDTKEIKKLVILILVGFPLLTFILF